MQQKGSKTNWHFYTSIAKSTLRIIACWALWDYALGSAAMFFLIAEILGIVEEL